MGRKQPRDDTFEKQQALQKAAAAAQREAIEAENARQAAAYARAKESVENIKTSTGKTAPQYRQEAEQAYSEIVPRIYEESRSGLLNFDPGAAVKPFAETAIAGIKQAGEYTGERIKQDVSDYGNLILAGTTEAGKQLLQYSNQAGRQQAKAFRNFERSAQTAQQQGLAQSYGITRGLSNLYNPEYQSLMRNLPVNKSNVLEDLMAKNLYRNV